MHSLLDDVRASVAAAIADNRHATEETMAGAVKSAIDSLLPEPAPVPVDGPAVVVHNYPPGAEAGVIEAIGQMKAEFSEALSILAGYIANQPAPVVNVNPTPVNVAAPVVNLPAPIVNVEPTPVTVEAAKAATDEVQMAYIVNWPEPKDFVVKRDRQGRMTEVKEQ